MQDSVSKMHNLGLSLPMNLANVLLHMLVSEMQAAGFGALAWSVLGILLSIDDPFGAWGASNMHVGRRPTAIRPQPMHLINCYASRKRIPACRTLGSQIYPLISLIKGGSVGDPMITV